MNDTIIVADSGPLIALGRIEFFPLLTQLLGKIIIPEMVAKECTSNSSRPGAKAIQNAIEQKIISVYINPEDDQFQKLSLLLGQGEAAAIALACILNTRLLIDEKLARSAAARLNLKVIGTAGVLLLAKKKGLIPAVLPLVQQLKHSGYYLADSLMDEVAKIAGENF